MFGVAILTRTIRYQYRGTHCFAVIVGIRVVSTFCIHGFRIHGKFIVLIKGLVYQPVSFALIPLQEQLGTLLALHQRH
ncbi:hypothetical protein D3C84_751240 [compost metagenome]